MMFLYVPHLILAGLMGIHSEIVTVSKVSVQAGGSISIPCGYKWGYTGYVKYLCKGTKWKSCSDVVRTDRPDNSGKFSISNDKKQRIFNVTINDPENDGSSYWCAVKNQDEKHKKRFELSVTDMPSLYVDQQYITAIEGGSVTVQCHFNHLDPNKKWCRLDSVKLSCVTGETGSIDGTSVTINALNPKIFTVTMSGLRMNNSGWYWCDNGDFQMPVHITVHKLTSTTTTTTATTTIMTTSTTMSPNTTNFTGTTPTITQNSSLFTSAEPHTAQPTNSTINGTGGENLQQQPKSSTMLMILIPTLILLLLVVPAVFLACRMRHSNTKPEGSDITAGSQIVSDPDVHYATVVHNRHAAAEQKQNETPEESVTYCTIVMKDSVRQKTEPVDGSVIYSTVKAN